MTASAEKRQALNIEFLVHLVERIEERARNIDGIIEEATVRDILYDAERR